MQEFKLCFFNHSSKKYIVPVKLPITFNLDGLPPWDESNNVRLRLQYDWMPRAVATQLMVSLHEHIIELPTKDQWIWRRGAVLDGKQLEIDDVKVRITEDWKKKMIAIDAKGEHSELLIKAVMKNWREVNQPFAEKVKVTPVILCPCKECETSYMPHQFKYQNVLKAKRMKKELQCQESFEMLPAADVLKGVFDEVTVMLDDSRINIGEEMADLIGEGELAEVIRQLPKDEFTVGFEQRLKYLKKQELRNTLSFDEINRHRNKLVQNLLDYLNDEFFHQGRQ